MQNYHDMHASKSFSELTVFVNPASQGIMGLFCSLGAIPLWLMHLSPPPDRVGQSGDLTSVIPLVPLGLGFAVKSPRYVYLTLHIIVYAGINYAVKCPTPQAGF